MANNNKVNVSKPENSAVMPSAVVAERTVLGAFSQYGELFKSYSFLLTRDCFYDSKNQVIYDAIEELSQRGKHIDLVTIANHLSKTGKIATEENSIYPQPYDISEICKGYEFGEWVRNYSFGVAVQNLSDYVDILRDNASRRELAKLHSEASTAAIQGDDMTEILSRLKRLSEDNPGGDIASMLADPSEESFFSKMSEVPTGIEVPYEFEDNRGRKKKLLLPGGALSFVCAPTSHGKSTFLRNLALEVARQPDPGRVLYFTFEESDTDVWAEFLNTYIDKPLNASKEEDNNLKTIKEYFRNNGSTQFMNREAKQFFPGYLRSFLDKIICLDKEGNEGKLKVINKDLKLRDLVSAIEYYYSFMKKQGKGVKAIFLDYIQLLSVGDGDKSRKEDLVEVTNELMHLSVRLKIPFVMAAQLNRETKSPLMLFNQNLSDASDIEKAANLIICLWNSSFEAQDRSYYGETKEGGKGKPNPDAKRLESKGFFAGGNKKTQYASDPEFQKLERLSQENKIYAKITKYRGEQVGLEQVFTWNPKTQRIQTNAGEGSADNSLHFDENETEDF